MIRTTLPYRLALCLLLSAFALGLAAQTDAWLAAPLHFLPDSAVNTWSYAGADFKDLAARSNQAAAPATTLTPQVRAKRNFLATAEMQLLQQSNCVGGGDREMLDTQGQPSLITTVAAAMMWQLTGHALHMDAAERAIYNAAWRTLTDSTTTAADRTAAAGVMHLVPRLMYGTDSLGHHFFVNLYSNATTNCTLQGQRVMLDQITQMPNQGDVKLRWSQVRDSLPMTLHLRMPGWVTSRSVTGGLYAYALQQVVLPRIYVNGHEVEQPQVDDRGYVSIERTWRNGDEVFLRFSLTPYFLRRTVGGKAARGALALGCGPRIYVVPNVGSGQYLTTTAPLAFDVHTTPQGNPALEGTCYDATSAPADAAAPASPFLAVPYQEGSAGSVWLREMK